MSTEPGWQKDCIMQSRTILAFFWQHIRPYKWHYLIMLSAPILGSFYPLIYNYAIKLFVDTMASQASVNYHDLLYPLVLFVFSQTYLDVIYRISNIAEWKSEPYVRRSILLESYDYIQHHSFQFFQDNFTGTISSKIKGILDGYDKFWAEMHHGLLFKVLKSVVNLCALALVSFKLGIFVLGWAAFYVPIMYKLSVRMNQLSFDETDSRHALMGQIADKITNMISLFSFASRRLEYVALDRQIKDDFIPKQLRMYRYNFTMQIVGGVLHLIMFGFMIVYMIHLRMVGSITIGDFAFVFGIAIVVSEDIWQATISLRDFARAMGDLLSSLRILEIPHDNVDAKDAQPLVITNANIEFRHVGFAYGKKHVVFSDLNLLIRAGEKVGLVGHSGAGKSTLVNLLLRYFRNDTGEILISGTNINDITQDSLRASMAVIPQDTLLFHRSIMENIRYGKPDATDEEVIEASIKARLHDFIIELPEQYNSFVGERGIKLSGGQRQRIAIARAILKDAPYLILDEATSSLDSETEKLIQDGLKILIENKQKTVIAIAHRLSTLKHMNRIIVLDRGKIIEQGTHSELISNKNSMYNKLWQLQDI